MNEQVILKEFTVEAEIFNIDLSEKIIKVLADEGFTPDPELYYDVDIVFDKQVYRKAEFYRYPIPEDKKPKESSKKQSKQERLAELIGAVLSSQLGTVRNALKAYGFFIDKATIIGDEHVDGVAITIFEGEKPEPVKGRKPPKHFSVDCIMPDRPFTQKQVAIMLANMYRRRIREEAIKEEKWNQHTPNLVSAAVVFTSISNALYEEKPIEAESLKAKLIKEARIENDWPLHICSRTCQNQDRKIEATALLDCSEYMVFQRHQSGRWELKTANDLKDAKRIIVKEGFNQKQMENILVLHNLEPVPYTLHIETEEGLRAVTIEEARGNKKLLVSWN